MAVHPEQKAEMRDHADERHGIERGHSARKLLVVRVGIVKGADAEPGEKDADAEHDAAHVGLQIAACPEDHGGQDGVEG